MENKMNPLDKIMLDYKDYVSNQMSHRTKSSFERSLIISGLGIAGESGEICDALKKSYAHFDDLNWNDETIHKLKLECGDLFFYFTWFVYYCLKSDLSEIVQMNKEKLMKRYKSGKFTTEEFIEKEKMKEISDSQSNTVNYEKLSDQYNANEPEPGSTTGIVRGYIHPTDYL